MIICVNDEVRPTMKLLRMCGTVLVVLNACVLASGQSHWQRLTHSPPVNVGAILLLTDGTVIAHQENDVFGHFATRKWYRLTPDIRGSYVDGTWSAIAPMPSGYMPLFFGSALLPDGRVSVEGGEDNGNNGEVTLGAIYDPVADAWTPVNPPASWTTIGDASTVVLPDGTLMLANCCTFQEALLNAAGLTWTATGSGKFDVNEEEGWTLLPNGKVLTVDTYLNQYDPNGTNSELYDPSTGSWTSAGSTVVQLWDSCGGMNGASYEIGPAVLRPGGTVFATGANHCGAGHTSIYNVTAGTWTPGPDFPDDLNIGDGPAALEVNGKVLMMANQGMFQAPSTFLEWDGSQLTEIAGPPNSSIDPSYKGHLLMLPTGQIMFTDYSTDVEVFSSTGNNYTGWTPTVRLRSSTLQRGSSIKLFGSKFNGASQNNAYGDDFQNATNYPLVRFTNVATGHVFYGRTHDHSTMAVGYRGPSYTHLEVPSHMETGATNLQVIVNGLASQNYRISIR
jgi:hypothetical protein